MREPRKELGVAGLVHALGQSSRSSTSSPSTISVYSGSAGKSFTRIVNALPSIVARYGVSPSPVCSQVMGRAWRFSADMKHVSATSLSKSAWVSESTSPPPLTLEKCVGSDFHPPVAKSNTTASTSPLGSSTSFTGRSLTA